MMAPLLAGQLGVARDMLSVALMARMVRRACIVGDGAGVDYLGVSGECDDVCLSHCDGIYRRMSQ